MDARGVRGMRETSVIRDRGDVGDMGRLSLHLLQRVSLSHAYVCECGGRDSLFIVLLFVLMLEEEGVGLMHVCTCVFVGGKERERERERERDD